MSPRIYSHGEMQEIVTAERKSWQPRIVRPQIIKPAGFSRRSFIKGSAAAIIAAASFRYQAKAAQFSTYMGYISVKDPTFGAVGNGLTDDTAHVQAALNFAYGSPASPHGNSGRFNNLAVFFPAGNYRITGPLYLVDIAGGKVFGTAPEMTTLSFESPGTGNTIIANGITPCFMTNGVETFVWEGMTIGSNSNSSTAGIYVFQNGTSSVLTTAPVFRNMIIAGFTDGILAGFQSNANCENGQLFNIQFNLCSVAGLRVVGQNTLNWQVYGGAASSCALSSTGPSGNSGAVFSCVTGGMSPVAGVSFSGNGWDVINNGFGGTSVIGGSSESNNSLGATGAHIFVSDFAWRPTNSSGNVFADVSNGGRIQASEVFLNPGNNNGPATAFALGNAGIAILDGIETAAHASTVSGTAGSKVYIRGCTFGGANPVASFTGTVGQNI